VKGLFSRLLEYRQQMGSWNAFWYCLSRVLLRCRVLVYKYDIMAQPVSEEEWSRGRGRKLRLETVTSLSQLPASYPRPAAVLADRFAQGAYSVQAWREDELAGFLWLIHELYIEDEVRVHYRLPSAETVWDFDVYVAPEFRLSPAYLRLWDEANRILRERQVRWSCSRISSFNIGSHQSHRRLGARKIGGALFLALGRWQVCFTDRWPFCQISRPGRHIVMVINPPSQAANL